MIIAVTQRYKKNTSDKPILITHKEYIDVLEKRNVQVYSVSSTEFSTNIASICDALIVTGGDDVNPALYNEKCNIEITESSINNDKLDYALIDAFIKANKPILGICRGIQVLNVFFGGSLYQDIPNHRFNTDNERHNVIITKNSFLDKSHSNNHGFLSVNSFHHQAIKDIAKGFSAVAISEDGYIEAIENNNILGVQWHPERLVDNEFFDYFIDFVNNSKKV